MRRKILLGILPAIMLLFCPGNASAEQTIRFGINPWGSEAQMRKIFRPLMDYLQEEIGIRIDIVIPSSYEDLIKRTANGEIGLASFNAVSLLKAYQAGIPIHYLATSLKREGNTEPRDFYDGYIIVRKDSPCKTIDDLRGKTFAFVEKDSASGYKMPIAFLATTNRGTPDTFFKKYFFVGSHDEVISAVYYKSVDGGATYDTSYALNTTSDKFGDAFRIIETISNIPNDAWVTGPKVSSEITDKLKAVLLSINEKTKTKDGRYVLDKNLKFPASGWSERSPEFYKDKADLLLYEQK